jgi:hypothetical protein
MDRSSAAGSAAGTLRAKNALTIPSGTGHGRRVIPAAGQQVGAVVSAVKILHSSHPRERPFNAGEVTRATELHRAYDCCSWGDFTEIRG